YQPSFDAPYSGTNSLQPNENSEATLSATLYLGLKLWKGAAIYTNPELTGGAALSNSLGVAAAVNGEALRLKNNKIDPYLASAYFVQTIGLGRRLDRKYDEVESAPNMLAGYQPQKYLRFYLGRLALNNLF